MSLLSFSVDQATPAMSSAKRFRAVVKQSVTYDIDYYFNMADKDPRTYIR